MNNPITGDIPAYLIRPPSSSIKPPVTTHLQELPYDQLRWEDFERLCLRCAREESEVESVRLYGEPGSAQAGIDLYARISKDGTYRVYQCKNESHFGPAKIRDAVAAFLNDKWATRATDFVLCTRESLRPAGRSDEIVTQTALLKDKGIALRVWDAPELNVVLKSHAKIVYDFFGCNWCTAFCGDEGAMALSGRLDADKLRELRTQLHRFYSHLFSIHDRGIPAASLPSGNSLQLRDRYVIPDILEERQTIGAPEARAADAEASSTDSSEGNAESRSVWARTPNSERTARAPLEGWFLGSKQFAITADFGLGKSALLRFLALDVLSERPAFSRLAIQWGDFVPVWVPFALWTKLISNSETSGTSIEDLLQRWLHGLNEDRLWPLIENALADDRLLLLVDGLDEWTDQTAASIAAQRLELFIRQRGLPIIVAGRPAGVGKLGTLSDGWKVGRIAEFSVSQQRTLSRHWFAKALTPKDDDEDAALTVRIESQVEELMGELAQPELSELAKVPLLLSILVFLKLQNVALPDSRFKAYDEMARQLINVHPLSRKAAAGVDDDSALTAEDAEKILGRLAYRIQCDFAEGAMPAKEAEAAAEDFIVDLGFDAPSARKYARHLVDSGGASTGILAMKFGEDIGFFHRSFQEYFAARYLTSLPLDQQMTVITERCRDVGWHEIILGLIRLNNRPSEVAKILHTIESLSFSVVERHDLDLLMAEVACGDYGAPAPVVARLLTRSIDIVERGDWTEHRERVLTRVLKGLRPGTVRERVRGKVKEWWPGISWRRDLYSAIATWDDDDDKVRDALLRGLHDEDGGNQRAAAAAIAKRYREQTDVGMLISQLALAALTPTVRASALEALALGWPTHNDLPDRIKCALDSRSPEMRWVAIFALVQTHAQCERDMHELLEVSRHRWGLDYHWAQDTPKLLAAGWPGSKVLKNICLGSDRRSLDRDDGKLDRNQSVQTMLRAFPNDVDVAKAIAQIIDQDKCACLDSFGWHDGWDLLASNFGGEPQIIRALDGWMPNQQYHEVELYYACKVGKTAVGKAALLAGLKAPNAATHWIAAALLDAWGMEDPDVASALKSAVAEGQNTTVSMAYLMPRIIGDLEVCYQRLLKMLQDPRCERPEFVIIGLSTLGKLTPGSAALTAALRVYWAERDEANAGIGAQLITHCSGDSEVRNVAVNELRRRNGHIAHIARAYGNDSELRGAVLARVAPLPIRLRDVVVSHLAERPTRDEFATAHLALFDHEVDPEVKTRASIAYHRRLTRSGADTTVAVQTLQRMIACYGPDYQQRRQAALCGVIEIGRLDVFSDALEGIVSGAETRTHTVDLSNHIRDFNLPLLECIAKNWVALKEATHGEVAKRLRFGSSAPWEVLSAVAAEHAELSADLLSILEMDEVPRPGPGVLRFIGRVRPRSELLRRYCFSAFTAVDSYYDGSEVAGELLAQQFRNDPSVFNDLMTRLQVNTAGTVTALCLGWPDSDELLQLSEQMKVGNLPMRASVQYALAFCSWDSRRILQLLGQYLDGSESRAPAIGNAVARAIVRRMRTDPAAYQVVLGGYQQCTDVPSLQCSGPGVLAPLGIGELGREILLRRLERESAQRSPVFGFDLATGEVQSVVTSLLRTLSGSKR